MKDTKTVAMKALFTLACNYYYSQIFAFDSLGSMDQEISKHLEIIKNRDALVLSAREFMEPSAYLSFQRELPWPTFKQINDGNHFINESLGIEWLHLVNGAN